MRLNDLFNWCAHWKYEAASPSSRKYTYRKSNRKRRDRKDVQRKKGKKRLDDGLRMRAEGIIL